VDLLHGLGHTRRVAHLQDNRHMLGLEGAGRVQVHFLHGLGHTRRVAQQEHMHNNLA
jgi:hypothetical protein